MSIWEYRGHVKDTYLIEEGLYFSVCPFCNTNLLTLREDEASLFTVYRPNKEEIEGHIHAEVCPTCGWWKASGDVESYGTLWDTHFTEYYGAIASLRDLDLTDISTPIDEVERFLTAKYQARYDVHPRLLEETVASVFRGLGYHTKVTAYSGDGGIDIILEGQDSKEIGVQVKRYRNSISVEQVRSLAGALLLGGYTKGIFVTTSNFQSGANRTAARAALRGIEIQLIDAEKFFDALKIVQRKNYETSYDLFAQGSYVPLVLLERLERL
jgi:hypothetical protein